MVGFNYGYAPIDEVWGDISGKKKKKSKSPPQDPMCDLYNMKGNSNAYNETELVNYVYDKSRNQRTTNDKQPKVRSVVIDQEEEVYESKNLPKSLFESQFDIKHPGNFDVEDPKEYMIKACKAPPTDEGDYNYEDEELSKKNIYNRQWEPPSNREEHHHTSYVDEERPSQERSRYIDEERPRQERSYYVDEERPRQERYEESPRQERFSRQEREEEQPRPRIPRRKYIDDETDDEYVTPKKNKPKYVYLDIILYVLSGIILIFLMEQFVRIGINMQMV